MIGGAKGIGIGIDLVYQINTVGLLVSPTLKKTY